MDPPIGRGGDGEFPEGILLDADVANTFVTVSVRSGNIDRFSVIGINH
jgi:hypothetical protein